MSRAPQRRAERSALDGIEEAVHLLRLAPASVLAAYYVGSVPFVLGLLYFWAEMSGGAYAYRHGAAAALGVSALYVWMKSWQAVFARQLYARLGGRPAGPWDRARAARLVVAQAVLQPTSLVALPLALLVAFPFGWVYAFYHNVTVCGDGRTADLGAVARESLRQSNCWPGQNHLFLALALPFALAVFLNLYTAVVLAPYLVKMLLGVESVFTRSGTAFLNTTLLAAVGGLTYLAVNPLTTAFYVLRCFHGRSRQTGEDLQAGLQALRPLVAVAAGLVLLGAPLAAAAGPAPDRGAAAPARTAELDRAIDEVLDQAAYTWRMPRAARPPETRGPVARFIDSVLDAVQRGWRALTRWGADLFARLQDWLRRWVLTPPREEGGGEWLRSLHLLAFALVATSVCCLVILCWRLWKHRRPRLEVVSEPVPAAPDLRDESVLADQLPAEAWLARARELLAAGELRLALRALFLASLAELAQRELIVIARSKSNREYARELERRVHGRPDLVDVFAQNVGAFERAWYGQHTVTEDGVRRFAANVDHLREGA